MSNTTQKAQSSYRATIHHVKTSDTKEGTLLTLVFSASAPFPVKPGHMETSVLLTSYDPESLKRSATTAITNHMRRLEREYNHSMAQKTAADALTGYCVDFTLESPR